jgi:hypothetical protein
MIGTVFSLAAGNASAVLITFDDVVAGTRINTQYAALGVTFSCVSGCASTDVFAVNPLVSTVNFAPFSVPNVISPRATTTSTFAFREDFGGVIEATFSAPVNHFSIRANNITGLGQIGHLDGAYVQVFNSSNTLLGTLRPAVDDQWRELQATLSDIGKLRLSGNPYPNQGIGTSPFASFDQLQFTFAGPGPGPSLPVPGTAALLALALAGLGFSRRKRAAK